MASVADTGQTPYLLRGTLLPKSNEHKSKIRTILLENPITCPLGEFRAIVPCYLKRWQRGFLKKKEIPDIVPIEIWNTKKNKETTVYIPQQPQTISNPLESYLIKRPLRNQPTPLPPNQHYKKLNPGSRPQELDGIPISEIEKLAALTEVMAKTLIYREEIFSEEISGKISNSKMHTFTLTYKQREFKLYIDPNPDGLGPFICLDQAGKGASKVVFKGIDLRSRQIVIYSFVNLQDEYEILFLQDGRRVPKLTKDRYLPAVTEQNIISIIEAKKAEILASKTEYTPSLHPHVIQYYSVINVLLNSEELTGSSKDVPMQIAMMKLQNKKDAFNEITSNAPPLTPRDLTKIITELFKGVAFLHSVGLIHKDLKPENLFLHVSKNGVLKLKIGDFGFTGVENAFCGSPAYLSPEFVQKIINSNSNAPVPQIVKCENDPLFTTAHDVYALSAILFSLLTIRFSLFSQSMQWINSRKHTLSSPIYNNTLVHLLRYMNDHPPRLAFEHPKIGQTFNEKELPTPILMNFKNREIEPPKQTEFEAKILRHIYTQTSTLQPSKRVSAQKVAELLEKNSSEVAEEIYFLRIQIENFNKKHKHHFK